MFHFKTKAKNYEISKKLKERERSLIITSFIICLFFTIKSIFFSGITQPSGKIVTRPVSISKKEEEDLQEAIEKIQQHSLWSIFTSQKSLFISKHYYSKKNMLFSLTETNTPLYPPIPNEWLLKYDLDYSNPNILSEDPSGDGFTNLEKWLGSDPYQHPGKTSFDPNNPRSHPLLWTKIRCYYNDLQINKYHFYFLGVDNDFSENIFLLQVEEPMPTLNSQGKNILSTTVKQLKIGEQITGTILKLIDFKKNITINKEIPYDTSTVTLSNTETQEEWKLIKKSRLNPNPTIISIVEAISLEYTLESPPRKITVHRGETFLLESLLSPSNSEQRDQEFYQFIGANDHEVVLEREGIRYAIPYTFNE